MESLQLNNRVDHGLHEFAEDSLGRCCHCNCHSVAAAFVKHDNDDETACSTLQVCMSFLKTVKPVAVIAILVPLPLAIAVTAVV